MNKIILLKSVSIFILLIFNSCTNEQERLTKLDKQSVNQSNFKINNANNAKNLAKEIYQDLDFKNYVIAYIKHERNINMVKNRIEAKHFANQIEFDQWIKNNLARTNFNNLIAYENSKFNLEKLKIKFLNKFTEKLEEYIDDKNFSNSFTNEIDALANEANRVKDPEMNPSCYQNARNCITRAQNTAAAGIAASVVTAFFNPIAGAASALLVNYNLSNSLEACQDTFDLCING